MRINYDVDRSMARYPLHVVQPDPEAKAITHHRYISLDAIIVGAGVAVHYSNSQLSDVRFKKQ